MTRQEYKEKLERGLDQVRAGQGITKSMEELERMAAMPLGNSRGNAHLMVAVHSIRSS